MSCFNYIVGKENVATTGYDSGSIQKLQYLYYYLLYRSFERTARGRNGTFTMYDASIDLNRLHLQNKGTYIDVYRDRGLAEV